MFYIRINFKNLLNPRKNNFKLPYLDNTVDLFCKNIRNLDEMLENSLLLFSQLKRNIE